VQEYLDAIAGFYALRIVNFCCAAKEDAEAKLPILQVVNPDRVLLRGFDEK